MYPYCPYIPSAARDCACCVLDHSWIMPANTKQQRILDTERNAHSACTSWRSHLSSHSKLVLTQPSHTVVDETTPHAVRRANFVDPAERVAVGEGSLPTPQAAIVHHQRRLYPTAHTEQPGKPQRTLASHLDPMHMRKATYCRGEATPATECATQSKPYAIHL
jgi:hypothetical protein